MTFLHPWLLAGLAGAAAPVLLHLLGRRSGRRIRFAAMEFLFESERRLAARRRIRELLLLLARAAVVILLALVLSRPLLEGARAEGQGLPVSVVAVIDATLSMAAPARGQSAFGRAQARLARAIESLPSGSEVAVLTLERRTRRATAGFVAPDAAIRALQSLAPGATAGRAGTTLGEALVLLGSAHRSSRRLLVASDLQAGTWDDETLRDLDLGQVGLEILDVAEEGLGGNLTLLAAPAQGAELRLEAARSGGADAPAESLAVLEAEGRVYNRVLLDFRSGAKVSAVLRLPEDLPPGAGARVVLEHGGALAADDRLGLWVERSASLRVLVGNGAPAADLYQDEAFYLERALGSEPGRFSVRVADASTGRLGALDQADVVALLNVERLEPAELAGLLRWVEGGGGLFVAPGSHTTPEALEAMLAGLLPGRPRALLAARPGEPPMALAPPPVPVHPIALPLEGRASLDALESVRVDRILAVEPAPGSEVVLATTNGIPALLAAERGKGRVVLLATSADRDWSNLPVRPAYVPLVTRSLRFAARRLERPVPHRFLAGDRVEIEDPPGEQLSYEHAGLPRQAAARIAEGRYLVEHTETPGAYLAWRGEGRAPELDFVVNVDPAEGDFTRIARPRLLEVVGEGALGAGIARGGGAEARLALPLLGLLALGFVLEALLGAAAARRGLGEDRS